MTASAPPRPVPDEYDVTIVVGSRAPETSLVRCLSAIEKQRQRTEVLVESAEPTSEAVRARFPWACFNHRSGALVPELWRDGIARARGRIVALTIAPMVPEPDWVEAIVDAHREHDSVGGAIEPGADLRWTDWAEYLCRYTPHALDFEPGGTQELAGDNASYKRALLLEESQHLHEGFWEPVIHPVLKRRGASFLHTPAVRVRMGRSGGYFAFARQRFEHGRLYPHQRGARFSRGRHALGVLGSPAVPFLMTLRVVRGVFAKRRFRARLISALPLIFSLNVVWALAEARGHLDKLVSP